MSFSFKKLFPEDTDQTSSSPPSLALGRGEAPSPPPSNRSANEPTPFDGGSGAASVPPFRPATAATAPTAEASPFKPASAAPTPGNSPSPFTPAGPSTGGTEDREAQSPPFAPAPPSSPPVLASEGNQSASPFAPAGGGTSAPTSAVSPFQAATGAGSGSSGDSTGLPVNAVPRSPEDMNEVKPAALNAGAPALPFTPSSEPPPPVDGQPPIPPFGAASAAPPASPLEANSAPEVPPLVNAGGAQPESISFGLRGLLVGLSADVLGFDPVRIPEAMKVELPSAGIVSQVPTGKVSVTLGEVVNALPSQFRAAFAKGNMDTRVKIPLQELTAALPSAVAPPVATGAGTGQPANSPSAAATSESPFAVPPAQAQEAQSAPPALPPFTPAASTGAKSSAVPDSPASSPFAAGPTPSAPPVASAPTDEPAVDSAIQQERPLGKESNAAKAEEPDMRADSSQSLASGSALDDEDILKPLKWDPEAKSTTLASESASLPPVLKMPAAPSFDEEEESQPLDILSAAPPAPSKSKSEDSKTASAATASPAVPKGPTLVGKVPAAPPLSAQDKSTSPASKSKLPQLGKPDEAASNLEPTKAVQKDSPAKKNTPAGSISQEKTNAAAGERMTKSPDFVLRALLSMEGTPTCENVVDHCVTLDGVSDCLVLRAGEVVPGSGQSGSTGVLASVAEGAFEKVTGLVNEIGISDADALTIQLQTGTLNFFVDDAACLAVLQDGSSPLGPGVRERLTILSQQLGTIPLA